MFLRKNKFGKHGHGFWTPKLSKLQCFAGELKQSIETAPVVVLRWIFKYFENLAFVIVAHFGIWKIIKKGGWRRCKAPLPADLSGVFCAWLNRPAVPWVAFFLSKKGWTLASRSEGIFFFFFHYSLDRDYFNALFPHFQNTKTPQDADCSRAVSQALFLSHFPRQWQLMNS